MTGRPRLGSLLVSAEQDAVALLPRIDLALEVDDADHLPAGCVVEFLDLRHRFRQQVHVFHRQQRQFQPDHAADLARPQPAAIHDMLRLHGALLGHHIPRAVRLLGELDHAIAKHDFCAEFACGLRIGMCRAGGVEMALDGIPHRADEVGLVHQREHRLGFGRRNEFRLHAKITAFRMGKSQEIHALRGVGHHHPTRQVEAAGLAGKLFDLLVELHRIGLQLRDVRVAVERMETARRMPG